MSRPIIERLLARLLRFLPPGRRDLGAALLAEAAAVEPPAGRVRWLMGGFWFVWREALMRPVLYGAGLLIGTAVVVTADRVGDSDDAGPVVLMVLLLTSAALGCVAPRRAWLAGLVPGAAIAVANLIYVTWGPARAHPMEPPGPGGAATLFVLVLPALIAAYLGAGARLVLRSR
jgi:hypothetical protein